MTMTFPSVDYLTNMDLSPFKPYNNQTYQDSKLACFNLALQVMLVSLTLGYVTNISPNWQLHFQS